jgi:hypothetical protein
MKVLNQLDDLANQVKALLCEIPDKMTGPQLSVMYECKTLLGVAVKRLDEVAGGNKSPEHILTKLERMKHRVPREIVVFPDYSFRTWTGLVKDAMGQQIAEETLESLGQSSTRDDVEQATVALAGRHGITIDSGYLHWDSHENTAIWLAGDDESPHGWVCCQRGTTDSIEDAKLGPIRLERSDAELDREVFGFTEIKFAYDGWLYETDVLEDESDGD